MFFFSHIFISKILRQHLIDMVELDEKLFSFGNVKPDIAPDDIRKPHTLDNYLFTVCDRSNLLMHDKLTREEFSVTLGEVCHYVCDFFCYFHVNEQLHKKKLSHFLYEFRLHMELLYLRYKHNISLKHNNKEPRKSISSIIMEMQKEYISTPKSYKRDIEYALTASLWICETIIYFRYQTVPFLLVNEIKHTLIPVTGA
ncbi:zinc dependent phospholipase C family protein [Mobilitalea sibirica]|uniref:Zinc dependent phospholipase C family protein n=1 Tax=Mobilitalea sibirica TaxID=1462919 RepID=A0A8J7H153_9FIRM|nr:zinc dependent phospholipase C family protein [Mobilitalea sibirica]MBH1939992.1 zinc dependent phospholipase C family protein [Mobilitalea sibirica]